MACGFEKFVQNEPQPFIVRIGQTGFGGDRMSYPIDKPLTTITTKAEHILINPIVVRNMGRSVGKSVKEPLNTVMTKQKDQLVSAHLVHLRGSCKDGMKADKPAPTITAGGNHIMLASWMLKYYGSNTGHKIDQPLQTITTKDRFALTQASLSDGELTDEQRYQSWWCARLIEQYGSQSKVKIKNQVPEPRDQLLMVGDFVVIDFLARMLQPRELFNAQGFPEDYIIDVDPDGKKITKKDQVARCGNSVPPQLSQALIEANLPELCKREVAA